MVAKFRVKYIYNKKEKGKREVEREGEEKDVSSQISDSLLFLHSRSGSREEGQHYKWRLNGLSRLNSCLTEEALYSL